MQMKIAIIFNVLICQSYSKISFKFLGIKWGTFKFCLTKFFRNIRYLFSLEYAVSEKADWLEVDWKHINAVFTINGPLNAQLCYFQFFQFFKFNMTFVKSFIKKTTFLKHFFFNIFSGFTVLPNLTILESQ